jgi:8-oxo-dGTP diphosphatase
MPSADSPSPDAPPRRPAVGAGLVCFKGDSVLLIKRGKPPRMGEWSIPGGHVEWGETIEAAALRETLEETSVRAEIVTLIEVLESITHAAPGEAPDRHIVLVDYAARWINGEPVAGDDATHAEFVPLDAVEGLGLWHETLRIIFKGARMMGLASPPTTG